MMVPTDQRLGDLTIGALKQRDSKSSTQQPTFVTIQLPTDNFIRIILSSLVRALRRPGH
jgi:hypothetical protein